MWEEYRKDGRKENRMGQTGIDEKKVHMAEKDKEKQDRKRGKGWTKEKKTKERKREERKDERKVKGREETGFNRRKENDMKKVVRTVRKEKEGAEGGGIRLEETTNR